MVSLFIFNFIVLILRDQRGNFSPLNQFRGLESMHVLHILNLGLMFRAPKNVTFPQHYQVYPEQIRGLEML